MVGKIIKIGLVMTTVVASALMLGAVITLLAILGLTVVSYLDLKMDLIEMNKKLDKKVN